MKKDNLYQWCNQIWLHVLYGIGIVMSCLLVSRWSDASIPSKLMYMLTIMVPLHVFEENTLPGGFFFMNNIGQKSDRPMVYPQNMLTNMITNLGAEILFIVILIFADYIPNTAVVVVILFGYAECIHHTMDGIRMYRRYADKGKRTIYGPGTITSYVGLIQLSTYGLVWLTKQNIAASEVFAGIGIILLVVIGLILIPFIISKRVQSNRFAFSSNGYFEKYEPMQGGKNNG
ncbi:MAG: HXXEE domain-containing protein [Clostridiales bacterium]|nr:HXXEE domain-containing protein [Clostridiales bacterium]